MLLLAGCRQIFGIDDPHAPIDAKVVRDITLDSERPRDAANLDCSQLPIKPPDLIDESQNAGATTLRISAFKFDNGTSYFVGAAGVPIQAGFKYSWLDTACAGSCVDQIEIGYVPGDRLGCPFDAVVPKNMPTGGTLSYAIIAPTASGWTSVRLAIGQNTSCTSATTWFFGPPPATDIVGYVCVH